MKIGNSISDPIVGNLGSVRGLWKQGWHEVRSKLGSILMVEIQFNMYAYMDGRARTIKDRS